MSEGKFIECNGCRKKLGSPTLCDGCLHNRRDITRLNADNRELKIIMSDNHAFSKGLQAACDSLRAEKALLRSGLDSIKVRAYELGQKELHDLALDTLTAHG